MRSTALVLAILLLLAQAANAAPSTTRQLEQLGYQPHIAQQIVAHDMGLAHKILELAKDNAILGDLDSAGNNLFFPGKKAWEPVTIYRGLKKSTFDPEHYSHKYDGDIFESPQPN